MVIYYALVALCFSGGALAQVAESGRCPKIDTMPDFDIRKIAGRWFEAKRFFRLTEVDLKCLKSDIVHDDGEGITWMNTTSISRTTGEMVVLDDGKIRTPDAAEPGKLELQLPDSPDWQKIWILGSDYDEFIVCYKCTDDESTNLKLLWILTRQQQPSETVIDNAVKVMEKQNLDATWLITADQTDCDAGAESNNSKKNEDAENSHILY